MSTRFFSSDLIEYEQNGLILDIDECLLDSAHNCSAARHEHCVDETPGFSCECDAGFRRDANGACVGEE